MKILNLKNLFVKKDKTTLSVTRHQAEKELEVAKKRHKKGHVFGGFRARNLGAIYVPQHKKLKGYEKENRKYRTNKTK